MTRANTRLTRPKSVEERFKSELLCVFLNLMSEVNDGKYKEIEMCFTARKIT